MDRSTFRSLSLFAVLLVSICADRACALGVDIYSGEAPVSAQTDAERARAAVPALAQALVKASGDASVTSDARLPPLLDQAPALMTSFTYRQDYEPGPAGTPVPRLYLVAQFAPQGVASILTQLRRPVWGADRPTTLVWLVVDDGTLKTIASAAQVDALGALTRHARERGIPLVFPRLDADDLAQVDAQTLWDGAPAGALAAASRYRAQVALIARLARVSGGWTGRFTLMDQLGSEQWTASYPESNGVLVAAAAGLADRVAKRFAVSLAERVVADHRIWIAGVESATDYARALSYLDGLSVVEAVEPEGADGNRLLVRVTLNVTLDRLRQMLGFTNVLRFEEVAPADGAAATLTLLRGAAAR
jgi:hypothetical protein